MQEYNVTVNHKGTIRWYQNGELHRIDGPAVEYHSGYKEWRQNDKLHRIDGPAIEDDDGYKSWWQNGQLHRLDGPAVECPYRGNMWFIHGKEYTEEEFNKQMLPVNNNDDWLRLVSEIKSQAESAAMVVSRNKGADKSAKFESHVTQIMCELIVTMCADFIHHNPEKATKKELFNYFKLTQ